MSLHKKLPHSKATPCMCCLNRFWACKRELALRHVTIAMRQVNTIINTHTNTHTHMYTHTYTCTYIHTRTHTHMYTISSRPSIFQVNSQIYVYSSVVNGLYNGSQNSNTYTQTHTHTHLRTISTSWLGSIRYESIALTQCLLFNVSGRGKPVSAIEQ